MKKIMMVVLMMMFITVPVVSQASNLDEATKLIDKVMYHLTGNFNYDEYKTLFVPGSFEKMEKEFNESNELMSFRELISYTTEMLGQCGYTGWKTVSVDKTGISKFGAGKAVVVPTLVNCKDMETEMSITFATYSGKILIMKLK